MTLGQKLSGTLQEIAAAKIREEEARETAQSAKIRKERAKLDALVERIIEHVRSKIEDGMVPGLRVDAYTHQTWLRQARDGKASHQDIWDRLATWFASEALEIVLREEHDGMGMKSWITVAAAPRQEG